MLVPLTGRAVGKLKKTVSMIAKTTTIALDVHPSQLGTLNTLVLGNILSDLPRNNKIAQGTENDTIWSTMLLLTNALKAAEDAR